MTSFCISIGVIIGSFGHFKCSRCTYEVGITHVNRTSYVGTVLYPNITGEVFIGKGGNFANGSYAKSAFSVVNSGGGNSSVANDFGGTVIKFSADKSNTTYANNHLQPAAFQTLIIIKI